MSKYIFDIESDGLLKDVSRMWCLVTYNLNTGEIKSYLEDDLDWKEAFDNASHVIGHNIVGYDLAVLKKLFKYTLPESVRIVDTLLLSQILDYKRFGNDGHSLERWGINLGYPKGDFHDWSHFSPEMLEYCKQDVRVNTKIYQQLISEYREMAERSPQLKHYIEAEHFAGEWCADAERLGWPFQLEKAQELKEHLEEEMQKAYDALSKKLGMKCVAKDRVKGVVEPKKPKWTKKGTYDAHTASWFDVDPYSGYDDPEFNDTPFHRMIKGEYSRVEFKDLSLDSSDDVKIFLFRHGWVPTEWNTKTDPETGRRKNTSPKITEDSLEFLGGDGKLYKDFLTVKSRYGILKTWLENVDENGRLHGNCMLIGTPSMRARHSIIVNVPSVDSPYGKEMRSLFGSLDGWSFIGADSAGNQARGLAHYLGDPEFIDILLNGDIHNYNAGKATEALEMMKIKHVVPRPSAKRILYATLFGASGGKLWSYIFGNMDDVKGKKFKALFLKAIPGFDELIKKLENIFGKTKQFGSGYIPSLAGNRIYCDSFHKLLVYLLQSCEKITCSAALMLTVKELRKRNIPYIPLIFYHDEIDFLVPNEYAEEASAIAQNGFKEGPKLFNVQIMDGGSKIGANWRECH